MAIAISFPLYVQSTFLAEFVSVQTVGWFFVAAMIFTIIGMDLLPSLIKHFSNYKIALILLVFYPLSILLLISTDSAVVALAAFIILTISTYLLMITMDIMVERFSVDASTGRTRAGYLTFINAGWLVCPLVSGWLVGEGNYRLVFAIAAIMSILMLVVVLSQHKKLQDQIEYTHRSNWQTVKMMWQQRNLRHIFGVAFILHLFYSFAVIYVPIYLNETLGFSWPELGVIFTIMLLPFVILEWPAGIIADKYLGEKEIMITGLLIMIIASFLIFSVHSYSLLVWAAILFFSRSGAALVESMRDVYFFKKVDVQDVDYINLFRNNQPLGYLVGSGLAVAILKFFPINYLFLFLAIFIFFGVYCAARLKDTK